MHRLFFTTVAVAILIFSGSSLAKSIQARKISPQSAAALVKGGPDSIGGIGDWHLTNGTLCAVISDIEHEHEFSAQGGALIDLGFCGRADDHFSFSQELLDGARDKPLNAKMIRADQSASTASILVTLEAKGVQLNTRYTLDEKNPTQLRINRELRATDPAEVDFNLISLGSFNYHSLEPFVLASQTLEKSPGFANVDFVSRGVAALGDAAHNADTIITLSPPEAKAPIAYGWKLRSADRIEGGKRTALPRFALADEESIAMLILADEFWLGDGTSIGWLQLPQIPFLSLDKDATLEFEEVIYVGQSASIAAVTNQMFTGTANIVGQAPPRSALHLLHKGGGALTHVNVGSDGQFTIKAPPGEYLLRHRGSAARSVDHAVAHGDEDTDLGTLQLPKTARLELPRGAAMRLVFVGLENTPSPDFADRLTDFSVSDEDSIHRTDRLAQIFLAGIESDPKHVDLVAGKYKVYATRGLEYSVESTTFSITNGETLRLDIQPPSREVDTPGYIAADLHVHAGDSFDNTFSNEERVRTFVAEHGEVMVNSEHDVVVDFSPLVAAMGVEKKITAMTGVEVTSLLPTTDMPYTGGHVNFFPYQPKPLEYRNGMVPHEGRRIRDVIFDVRARNPGALAQLNHPRKNLSLSNGRPKNYQELVDHGSYFDHMGIAAHPYDPSKPLHSHPNNTLIEPNPSTGLRDLDFDAIEVINPGGQYHHDRLEAVRKDWMSFLLQGERLTGTANSDSHRGSEQVAVPRNMVAVSDDGVNSFSRTEFLASLKRGDVFGTTGPMLNIDLSGIGMGGTYRGDSATLTLKVSSASWIPIDLAEIQINDVTVHKIDISEQKTHHIDLQFERDSIVTVEIHGEPNETYLTLYPEITPYAFSNPIYVDANADGEWQAPGLATVENDLSN